MFDASNYSAAETTRDGRKVNIRSLRPEDRAGMIAAVGRTSTQSLYRRFFAFKRDFTEKEIDFYINVDFVSHAALVALMEESGQPVIVAGGRYIVVQPAQAEIAFVVDDAHQGKGIGSILLRHLAIIGRHAGLTAFVAEVLPENAAMLKVFEASGLGITTRRASGVVHVTLQL
ncbi:GNAT family N-acetyltransferase [Microbacteriaceae bacterium K1510]|nr:GNAT family N-acetyltransferase [Microbacteriaceae bacterium K1510]